VEEEGEEEEEVNVVWKQILWCELCTSVYNLIMKNEWGKTKETLK
jgi:hypothetical protein